MNELFVNILVREGSYWEILGPKDTRIQHTIGERRDVMEVSPFPIIIFRIFVLNRKDVGVSQSHVQVVGCRYRDV